MPAASGALAAGLGALTESVRDLQRPANAIRMLYALATCPGAAATLCRWVALGSLARACADFVPASYDDAVAIRGDVAGVPDAEARVAADGGDAATCLACATCGPRSSTASRRAPRSSRASWSWPARPRSPRPRSRTSSTANATRADDLVAAAWCGSTSRPP